jgi:hypothetical protein
VHLSPDRACNRERPVFHPWLTRPSLAALPIPIKTSAPGYLET